MQESAVNTAFADSAQIAFNRTASLYPHDRYADDDAFLLLGMPN